jgi:hypothetical protein
MKTIKKLETKVEELQRYTEENTTFGVVIKSDKYPLTIEFYQEKIDMFTENISDISPSMTFVFNDEMRIVTVEEFKINETIFNKLKNLSKEINRLYLHAFREEFDSVINPLWNACNDKVQVAIYNKAHFESVLNQFE